uniref:NADH-ubiquinone oxidoreductase chain 6 n=1 Tax=Tenebrionoidea sp. 18 KM-2017 TaxID=2219473 RepID=A0A346RHK1_9CUCU|nr:NADH dehydrogenase subunit 6 [Tenebrionoidea sp. 18 KM-2017]
MNMMILNMSFSLIFIFLTHPVSLGGTLLIQTILISLITGNLNMNFWFSYILFLIMIGGMLVLFLYMTSIASNEMFSMNFLLITPFILPAIYLLLKKFNLLFQMHLCNEQFLLMLTNTEFPQNLNKFTNAPSCSILFLMITYLLITLIAIVKITQSSSGPLRQMN